MEIVQDEMELDHACNRLLEMHFSDQPYTDIAPKLSEGKFMSELSPILLPDEAF